MDPRKTPQPNRETEAVNLKPAIHRRILNFVNLAARPKDLMFAPQPVRGLEGPDHEDNPEELNRKPEPIFDQKLAKAIFDKREVSGAFGFRDISELFRIDQFDRGRIARLMHLFGDATYGHWEPLGYDTQRPNGSAFSVAHAAMLHTGQVLFLPQFDTTETLLWDPTDEVNPQFEFPNTQPTEFLFCSGHSFLYDGKLLTAGGGGNSAGNAIASGWKFDPVAKTWTQTTGSMNQGRWYPTNVTLGDNRVLVTCGNTIGEMEIYNPVTDSFLPVTMPITKSFPARYPGFHLLPSGVIFFSRTGWHGGMTAGSNGAYFTFTGPTAGMWTEMTTDMAFGDRREGMSVMLLQSASPYLRIVVIGGGGESAGLNSAETMDVSALSPVTPWNPTTFLPEARTHVNAVLLPDGTVFVCGGMSTPNSPCRLYNPSDDTWSEMAALSAIKGYHSVALLLPSGKVMIAGGSNNAIEIFSPPYLFQGPRPTITSAPVLVHHGQSFIIESPDAASIVKVVLVRPMAVTHQTDSEQKVLEMPYIHDHANPTRLTLTAPHGGHPHSLAQEGYYMMFAINNAGVPSIAKWIQLH